METCEGEQVTLRFGGFEKSKMVFYHRVDIVICKHALFPKSKGSHN